MRRPTVKNYVQLHEDKIKVKKFPGMIKKLETKFYSNYKILFGATVTISTAYRCKISL